MTFDPGLQTNLFQAASAHRFGTIVPMLKIGELAGLLSHGLFLETARDLREEVKYLRKNAEIFPDLHATARFVMRWIKHTKAEFLGADPEDVDTPFDMALDALFLSSHMISEPGVDRGALLSLLLTQMTQFSPARMLVAHEEVISPADDPDDLLPADMIGSFVAMGAKLGLSDHLVFGPDKTGKSNLFLSVLTDVDPMDVHLNALAIDAADIIDLQAWSIEALAQQPV